MLHKSTSIMIVLALSTFVLPQGASEEVLEKEYTVFGVQEHVTGEDVGFGLLLFPETENSCYYTCSPHYGSFGGANFFPEDPYTHLTLHLDDVVFGEPANLICFYNPDGDPVCDEDDHSVGMVCGGHAVSGAPFPTDEVTVFMYVLYVTPAFDVCLGSTGTMTATFS